MDPHRCIESAVPRLNSRSGFNTRGVSGWNGCGRIWDEKIRGLAVPRSRDLENIAVAASCISSPGRNEMRRLGEKSIGWISGYAHRLNHSHPSPEVGPHAARVDVDGKRSVSALDGSWTRKLTEGQLLEGSAATGKWDGCSRFVQQCCVPLSIPSIWRSDKAPPSPRIRYGRVRVMGEPSLAVDVRAFGSVVVGVGLGEARPRFGIRIGR